MDNKHEIQVNGYEIIDQQEINLREYWEKIWRRKTTVIAVTLAVLTLGSFWTFTRKPVYTATSTLLIEKEPNILSFQDVLQIETMRDDFYQTQYKLLESRGLADEVIARLSLYEKREFVGDSAKRKTPVDPDNQAFRETLVNGFLGRLQVRPVRLTRLVQVNFSARDPKLAADCVNSLADAFIDMNINLKYAATEQATKFLADQIDSLQKEIEQKSQQLQDLEAEANIVALSDNETTIIDRLGEFNKALTEAKIDRVNKEAVWNELRNASADYIPEAINNPLIQRLREDYVRLKREFQKMEERFQPDYPELQRLAVELDSARTSLEEETQNLVKGAYSEFQTALNRERSLENMFNDQKKEAFNLNSSAILYNGLKIEIANSKNLLDSLLRRESETGVAARLKGLRTSNIRIVDRARTPIRPSSPNKRRNLVLALFLGFGGGVGLALLFDYLDNSIKTAEDVERYAGLPTLGVVPSFKLDGAGKGRLLAGTTKLLSSGKKKEARAGVTDRPETGKGRPEKQADPAEYDPSDWLREATAVARASLEDEKTAAEGGGEVTGDTPESISETGGHIGAEAEAWAKEGRETAADFSAGDVQDAVAGDRIAGTPDTTPFTVQVPADAVEPRAIELAPFYSPNSRLAESYRSIRTALLLSSADRPVKTIVVTSALPGEGKTVSVANLGITLAQSDKTVLIVDTDLRKPRQHRIFKIKNVYGLTSYLTEKVELKKVIKRTPIPNLYLVNSGPIPPNPAELLGSEKMAKFINLLKDECDHILFDMPPMLEISDALILGSKIDGIVLVVHGDKTSREALKRAREKLDLLKVRTLGVIINNVNVQKHSYYYGNYYYGKYYNR